MSRRPSSHDQGQLSLVLALHGILLLALVLSAGGLWLRERGESLGVFYGVPSPITPTVVHRLGTNVALEQYGGDQLTEVLDQLQAADVRWLRQRFPWAQIEPQVGQYVWSPWDQIVESTSLRGLHLIAVLDTTPLWARAAADLDNPFAPPQERADFGRFAAAFAQRYGAQIDFYQIWDEPNIQPHWGARGAEAGDYLGLLREGYLQVKNADADALIAMAGLAPTVEQGGANLSDISYLDNLYRLGASAWFDIAAAKPYGFDLAPSIQDLSPGQLQWSRLALLRQVMEKHGDAHTPLWAVEFGWNALPRDWDGPPSIWGQVDEAAQASYLADAYTGALRDWPWLGQMLWYTHQPPVPPDDPRWGFALVDSQGRERPVWSQLSDLARPVDVLPPGVYAPDHPALRYAGSWQVTPRAADIGQTGDKLEFEFSGTRLDVDIQRGPYWAYLAVEIDGEPANALPRDNDGVAYVVLHDPLGQSERVTLARELPDGIHSARIVAHGGWGQWALQSVVVSREQQRRTGFWIAALLTAAALTLGNGLRLAARQQDAGSAIAGWRDGVRRPGEAWRALPEWFQVGAVLALAALFSWSPWTAVDLLSLAGLALLLALRLDLVLPLIAFAIPFFVRPKSVLGYNVSHLEVFTLLGTALLVCRMLGRTIAAPPQQRSDGGHGLRTSLLRLHRPGFASLDWPVLTFVAVSALSLLAASQKGVALREFRVIIVEAALCYVLVSRVATNRARFSLWPIIDGLFAGALVVSLFGLVQLASGQGRVDVEGVWRIRAFYGSPNNLGLYLERILPLLGAVAAFGQARWRRWTYGTLLLPIGVACFFTFSKGALLVGLPASVLFLGAAGTLHKNGKRRWVPLSLAGALLISIALAVVPLLSTERFTSLFNLTSGTSFFRLQLWQGAWNMVRDHPWLGVGLDNFLYLYRTRYVLPTAWEELNLSHPHNILLDFWTRLGVLGVASGIWLLAAGFRKGWQAWRQARDRDLAALLLGLLASLVATVAHGLIDNSIFLVDLAFVFMLTLGVFERLRRAPEQD